MRVSSRARFRRFWTRNSITIRSAALDKWGERVMDKPIKGKYGEPQGWDGLSTMFVILAQRDPDRLTKSERDWLKALGPDAAPVT